MDKTKLMTEFANPLIFFLLPLPLIVRFLSKPSRNIGGEPLITPFFNEINQIKTTTIFSNLNKKNFIKTLAFFAWIFLIIAAARPRWVGEPMPVDIKGRELLLAIDVSGSMKIADFVYRNQYVQRMLAVRDIASDFINKRCGDKLGLIFFGSKAYLRSPPSFDCQTVYNFMKDAEIGVAGTNTAIGDAIALAVKYTKNKNNKVLVLLTDGTNTSGYIAPDDAIKLAVEKHLKIYTIGIGSKQNPQNGLFGLQFHNSDNDIDEDTLKNIASKTGGKFYLAQDSKELSRIYGEIDKLEPISENQNTIRPIKELFYIPLMFALTLVMVILLSFIKTNAIINNNGAVK